MIAEKFIDRLEEQGLLDANVIAELRRKISKINKPVTAEAIAKLLVDKGHLTRFQAVKLVGDVSAPHEKPVRKTQRTGKGDLTATRDVSAGGDELGFAVSDSDIQVIEQMEEDEEIVELEDASQPAGDAASHNTDDLTNIDVAPEPVAPKARRKPEKPKEQPASPAKKKKEPAPPPPAPEPQTPPAAPLDDLMDDGGGLMDLDDEAAAASPLMPSSQKKKGGLLSGLFGGGGETTPAAGHAPARRIEETSQWDSKLLLVGFAILGVLLVLLGFLAFSLTRGSAEELFQAGEEEFLAGSYTQAVNNYKRFLDKYPGNPNASLARVRIGVSELRQVYSSPQSGLTKATAVLPELEEEEAFDQGLPDFAEMLVEIAEGFIEQAIAQSNIDAKEQLLIKTREAMELVGNSRYMPTSLRRLYASRIQIINENMLRVDRDINEDRDLRSTITAIEQAVANGDTTGAYLAREELLNEYPGLSQNASLNAAVKKITEREREQVRVVQETRDAFTDDPAGAGAERVVMSGHRGTPVPGVTGQVVFFLAAGSVFAINAEDGEVLWSRFVGHDTEMAEHHPFPVSQQTVAADAIAVDVSRNELLRLDAATGNLVWRLPLDEPFAPPVLVDQTLYVSTQSGRVYEVDVETGSSGRYVQLPQSLGVGAGMDEGRPYLYQVGDHDNLFVLSRDTLECEEVFYLGHQPGSVEVGPVMVLGHLFVAENQGTVVAQLHVFLTDDRGLNLRRVESLRSENGHIVMPLLGERRRIMVVTDRRAIQLYDVEPNDPENPVVLAAGVTDSSDQPVQSHVLIDRGYMWVADVQLSKKQIQTARGRLPDEWINQTPGRTYVAPLRIVGDVLYTMYRHSTTPGFTVAAFRINDEDPQWETDVAVPTGQLLRSPEGEGIHAVSAAGHFFEVAAGDFQDVGMVQQMLSEDQESRAWSESIPLPDGRWIFSAAVGYQDVLVYDSSRSPPLQSLTLNVPAGAATAPPTLFMGGLLVPLNDGQIALLDLNDGTNLLLPFHPEVPAGADTQWRQPAVLEGSEEFVVADNHGRLFRVGIELEPHPHLATRAMRDGLRMIPERPMAAIGETVFGFVRSAAGDLIVAYNAQTLEFEAASVALDGRITWGPSRRGDGVLVVTTREVVSLGEPRLPALYRVLSGEHQWRTLLDAGPLAGPPHFEAGELVLATVDGSILRLDAATGETREAFTTGFQFSSSPVALGDQWVVASSDGSLLRVARAEVPANAD